MALTDIIVKGSATGCVPKSASNNATLIKTQNIILNSGRNNGLLIGLASSRVGNKNKTNIEAAISTIPPALFGTARKIA